MPNFFRLRHSNPPEPNRNSTAVFADDDGTLKQVAADGTVTEIGSGGGGGGGSRPVYAQYAGNEVTINNASSAKLPFDIYEASDAPLLDISVPTSPTFLTAGVYAITIWFTASDAPLTAEGYAALNVYVTPALVPDQQQAGVSSEFIGFDPSLCTVVKTDAGGTLEAIVNNQDGAASRSFYLTAQIIKLG